MSCGYEGPRGGGCDREGLWKVSAGDFETGPHASAYACDRHLDDVKTWVYSKTRLMPEVAVLSPQTEKGTR